MIQQRVQGRMKGLVALLIVATLLVVMGSAVADASYNYFLIMGVSGYDSLLCHGVESIEGKKAHDYFSYNSNNGYVTWGNSSNVVLASGSPLSEDGPIRHQNCSGVEIEVTADTTFYFGATSGGTIEVILNGVSKGYNSSTGSSSRKSFQILAGKYTVQHTGTEENPNRWIVEVNSVIKEIILSDAQKPTAVSNLVYNSSKQELIKAPAEALPDGAVEMQYAIGTNATTPPTTGWGTSIPTATEAGTYYAWYKVVGDENHTDSDAACITVTISANRYSTISVTNGTHTISDGKDVVLTVKGEPDDSKTYDNFTGVEMDGKAVAADNYTTAKGSLILTLKAAYLDTLATGEHKVTINFKDGSTTANLNIKAAAPKPLPKTGDTSAPFLWIALVLLGMLGLGISGRAYGSRRK